MPVIDVCASVPQEGTEAEALARLRREHRLERVSCVTLMPEGDYQLHVIEAPSVPPSELKSAVRWRLKDVLDYPADAATIDVFPIPGDPDAPTRDKSLYAIAAPNELIAARMEMFAEAKMRLTTIDIPEMAQRNVAALFESPGQALAMLSLTEERGLLTFTANTELYLTRAIGVGLAELRHAEGALREQLFDRLAVELQRSLDHFDRQYSFVPLEKIVLAPLPEDIDLQAYLAEKLFVPVETARLESCVDLSHVPDLASPAMQAEQFMTIGAALRQEASL